jgi:hypothetical protein
MQRDPAPIDLSQLCSRQSRVRGCREVFTAKRATGKPCAEIKQITASDELDDIQSARPGFQYGCDAGRGQNRPHPGYRYDAGSQCKRSNTASAHGCVHDGKIARARTGCSQNVSRKGHYQWSAHRGVDDHCYLPTFLKVTSIGQADDIFRKLLQHCQNLPPRVPGK